MLEDQSGFADSLLQIANYWCAADPRRRSELFNCCRTLDDLVDALKQLGYQCSRSATYLYCYPRDPNTTEGKRHLHAVPVKLRRAQNNLRKPHEALDFCFAVVNMMNEMASIMGPECVLYLSPDDKCRIPLGLCAGA